MHFASDKSPRNPVRVIQCVLVQDLTDCASWEFRSTDLPPVEAGGCTKIYAMRTQLCCDICCLCIIYRSIGSAAAWLEPYELGIFQTLRAKMCVRVAAAGESGWG